MTRTFPLTKVLFKLGDDEWHGFGTESVWAERLSHDRCRLRNTPFFAKGVSLWDIVAVSSEHGNLVYKSTLVRSGHSTYRLLISKKKPLTNAEFQRYWQPLQALGCSYEGGSFGYKLYAVDAPPEADIHEVYRILENGEKDGLWDFEEGHCSHSVK